MPHVQTPTRDLFHLPSMDYGSLLPQFGAGVRHGDYSGGKPPPPQARHGRVRFHDSAWRAPLRPQQELSYSILPDSTNTARVNG